MNTIKSMLTLAPVFRFLLGGPSELSPNEEPNAVRLSSPDMVASFLVEVWNIPEYSIYFLQH